MPSSTALVLAARSGADRDGDGEKGRAVNEGVVAGTGERGSVRRIDLLNTPSGAAIAKPMGSS